MSEIRSRTITAGEVKAGDVVLQYDWEGDCWDEYPVTAVSVEVAGPLFNPQEVVRLAFTDPDGRPNTMDYHRLTTLEVAVK
jgi:hypothetical protein